MIPICVYPSAFDKNFTIVDADAVMDSILNGQFEEQVRLLRSYGKHEYDNEKKKLPSITWSGTFKKGERSIGSLVQYSQLVVLDIDKLEPNVLSALMRDLHNDRYVRYAFTSPSGKGIKVIFKVNTQAEHHRAAFNALKDYFENTYLVKVDPSGKDPSRLCFISSDMGGVKKEGEDFFVDPKYIEVARTQDRPMTAEDAVDASENKKKFDVCVALVSRTVQFEEGSRNNFIHSLACALNRFGMKQEDAYSMISANYVGLEARETYTTVRSAYFHNQHEFNTKGLKDAGETFIAPPYIANFTDDVVVNDIMRNTAMLFHHKVPEVEINHLITKLANYYAYSGYLDERRLNIPDLISMSQKRLSENILSQAEQLALPVEVAEGIGVDIVSRKNMNDVVPIGLPTFDMEMFGGLLPGTSVGIIGMGESMKSILAQRICYNNALLGVPSLYLNGEMSKFQFYQRLITMAFNLDMRKMMEAGTLTEENVNDFIRQLNEKIKSNVFVVSNSGWTKESVLATIDTIYHKYGKKIKVVIADGITHYDWGKNDEISATIKNSMMVKELAKEAHGGAGVCHVSLIHISGDCKRHYRDTGKYVRGGKKVLANLDAYFCTSRLIDPNTNNLVNEDEVKYIPYKFYLRYVDKRSSTGEINKIINVQSVENYEGLILSEEASDPSVYELRVNKSQMSKF